MLIEVGNIWEIIKKVTVKFNSLLLGNNKLYNIDNYFLSFCLVYEMSNINFKYFDMQLYK